MSAEDGASGTCHLLTLNTRQLKSLIMYVQDGHALETHDDVPGDVREELYAEEQKLLERNQKVSGTSEATPESHQGETIPSV